MKPFRGVHLVILLIGFSSINSAELVQDENDLIVDAGPLGPIEGVRLLTLGSSSRSYLGFQGLKYAYPPTGEMRFKPSVPFDGPLNEKNPDKPYNAKIPGFACRQPNVVIPIPQSEDCLSLNVYTPATPERNNGTLYPVIFFIHGGAFTAGMGSQYTGARLLNKDVVVVSINYRLGSFGFFYLENEDVPGNAGMYDMINALIWTQKYISYFGGDPNRVTIAGQSAGGVLVTHLLASPLASGLFHGAIGVSGSALASWGTASKPMETSYRIAELSGCYERTDEVPDEEVKKQMADCMRTVDGKVMVDALFNYQVEERKKGRLAFDASSPVIQDFPLDPQSDFVKLIPVNPQEVYEAGEQSKVPLMIGATRHDGSFILGVYYNKYLKANGLENDREYLKNKLVPKILEAFDIESEFGIENSINKMYLGEARKTGLFSEMYPGFVDIISVFFFKSPGYELALHHSRVSDTYYYSFDYKGANTMFNLFFGLEQPPMKPGIGHGDDIIFLFQATLGNLNAEDAEVSRRMVDLWVNFAYYGNPTPSSEVEEWPLLDRTSQNYYSIGKESKVLNYYEESWSGVGVEIINPEN